MKLSDAIALGRLDSTLIAGPYVNGRGGRCSLGMALHAIGVTDAQILGKAGYVVSTLADSFEINPLVDFPCDCHVGASRTRLTWIVAHLSDKHVVAVKDWTLDQLIEWVREQENRAEEPARSTDAEQAITDSSIQEVCQ